MTDLPWVVKGLIVIVLAAIATGCLFWPKAVQRFAVKVLSHPVALPQYNPFMEWIHTSSYRISVRIVGVVALAMLLIVGFVEL